MAKLIPSAALLLLLACAHEGHRTPPFFAFCIDMPEQKAVNKRTLPGQAELMKKLGYDGTGHVWVDQVEERLQSLEGTGLKLYQLYVMVTIEAGKPPYKPKLKEVVPLLKDHGTMICPLIVGGKPSDPAGDARAVEIVREISDMAAPHGLKVALYPHHKFWLETVGDAVRVAKKADRANVGAIFNTSHFVLVEKEEDLRGALKNAMPHLMAININGADQPAEVQKAKGESVRPLDSGTFDAYRILKLAKDMGYDGPVGLQCYGIGGDAADYLSRSMSAWRRLQERLASDH